MESILFSVDYASIIVYESKFSIVYWYRLRSDIFCTAKIFEVDADLNDES